TPAGMLTRSFLTVRTAPLPGHVGQGSSITVPAPPHSEHGWEIENIPWPCVSMPRPSQRGHTFGVVPGFAPVPWQVGHAWCIGTCSGTCAPETAWSKVIDTCASRSAPFSARGFVRTRRPLVEPPNRLERMSPIEAPSKSKLPKPPKPPPGPAPVLNGPVPLSYCLRFSVAPGPSCACEISLKRASASLSPGLRSGWYWRASLRYAFLISSALARLSTPSVL